MNDPEDGLPIAEDVGEWASEKHERLRKYIDITRETRRKYTDPSRPAKYRGGATYIDLFCGPGRAKVRDTDEIIDGSPVVAWKASVDGKVPFSEMHIADLNPAFSDAAVKRIVRLGGPAIGYAGYAEDTAKQIVSRVNQYGLHFAFLDPYSLGGLSFEIIRTLATLKRIDILMHISVQDLQRNADRYTAEEFKTFDVFAPGWRSKVNVNQSLSSIRTAILAHWQNLIRSLGFLDMRSVELVRGSKNQRLYWLAFVSRSRIANYFWDEIRNVSGQGELGI